MKTNLFINKNRKEEKTSNDSQDTPAVNYDSDIKKSGDFNQNPPTLREKIEKVIPQIRLYNLGYTIIPIKKASKKPSIPWKFFQERRPTIEEVQKWFEGKDVNTAIICGKVSNNLVVIDFDDKDSFEAFSKQNPNLVKTTPVVKTAKGFHVYVRMTELPSNGKFYINGKLSGDIKSEGGYVICPPSVHHSGTQYEWVNNIFEFEVEVIEDLESLGLEINKKTKKSCGKTNLPIEKEAFDGFEEKAAIRKYAEELSEAQEGERNNTLYKSSLKIAQKIRHDREIEKAKEVLFQIGIGIGLDEQEILKTIESGFLEGLKKPCFSYDDKGLVQRFCFKYRKKIMYIAEMDCFFIWVNGWKKDENKKIYFMLDNVFEDIPSEIDEYMHDKEKEKEKVISFYKSTRNLKKKNRIIEYLKKYSHINVSIENLDNNPYLLQCKNFTIDLNTLDVREKRSEDYLTQSINTDYDAEAKAPIWEKFIATTFENDLEVIDFVQRVLGYALTGSTKEQLIFFLWGTGESNANNGKSTFAEVLLELFGDYGAKVQSQTLLKKRSSNNANNDIARLKGKRFIIGAEIPDNAWLDESILKDMSGNDKLTARFLYGEYFEFSPEMKVFFYSNHQPYFRGSDAGMKRRIRVIPFLHTVTDKERDPDLKDKLIKELPGILNWLLEGLRKYNAYGFAVTPEIVKEETAKYVLQNNSVLNYIKDLLHEAPGEKLLLKSFYIVYKQECLENGESPLGKRKIANRLREMGIIVEKSTGNKTFIMGYRLIREGD